MDWITKFLCIIAFVWVIGMYIAIIADLVGTFKCDDISEKKKQTNQTNKDLRNKRSYYIFCIKDTSVVDGNRIYHYLRKIDEYLTSYNLEQFDRFYTVYCKELYNTLKKISECKCASLYYDLVMETRKTYGSIFSKMLSDIEATIKNNTTSDTDIEGIKNFAKINGDFDENYKAGTESKSVSDTDTTLTSTTSAVEYKVNYADALNRAYEKVSQYKKENAQLAKELENCRAEAKRRIREGDLARIDRIIDCRERSARNDAALKLMRETRDEIARNTYRNSDFAYRLYANDALIDAGSWVTDYSFDYSDGCFLYDGLDRIMYESL